MQNNCTRAASNVGSHCNIRLPACAPVHGRGGLLAGPVNTRRGIAQTGAPVTMDDTAAHVQRTTVLPSFSPTVCARAGLSRTAPSHTRLCGPYSATNGASLWLGDR